MKAFIKALKLYLVVTIIGSLVTQPLAANMGKTYYYIKDHLGSTRVIIDRDSRRVESSIAYYPFGSVLAKSSSPELAAQEYEGFTAKVQDGESALLYFGARYYDAELATWITPDPLAQFDSPYTYAGYGTNPVTMVDEDGRFIFPLIMMGVAIAAGAYGGYKIGKARGEEGVGLFAHVIMGGVFGFMTAGLGAAAGAASAGIASGFAGAAISGAIGGAVGSGASGYAMGHLAGASGADLWDATWQGAAVGAVGGAAGGGAGYASRGLHFGASRIVGGIAGGGAGALTSGLLRGASATEVWGMTWKGAVAGGMISAVANQMDIAYRLNSLSEMLPGLGDFLGFDYYDYRRHPNGDCVEIAFQWRDGVYYSRSQIWKIIGANLHLYSRLSQQEVYALTNEDNGVLMHAWYLGSRHNSEGHAIYKNGPDIFHGSGVNYPKIAWQKYLHYFGHEIDFSKDVLMFRDGVTFYPW